MLNVLTVLGSDVPVMWNVANHFWLTGGKGFAAMFVSLLVNLSSVFAACGCDVCRMSPPCLLNVAACL